MALHTLALTGTVPCLGGWMITNSVTGSTVLPADIAAINLGCCDDNDFGALLQGLASGAQAVIATGTTNGTATITAVTKRAGAAFPLPVTQIRAGDLVVGVGVVPGTFVQSISGSTVTLSRATTGSGTGVGLAFMRPGAEQQLAGPNQLGQLYIPSRGVLKILPGDVVAVDNTGWPVLISSASINYAATQWTFT
jgi:hypothetical protein